MRTLVYNDENGLVGKKQRFCCISESSVSHLIPQDRESIYYNNNSERKEETKRLWISLWDV